MSSLDTTEPECTCIQDDSHTWRDCGSPQHARNRRKELAFEHDFARLTQQARAAHAFYEGGLEADAAEWLLEIIHVARGLRAALQPCDHRWKLDETGALVCEEGCTNG